MNSRSISISANFKWQGINQFGKRCHGTITSKNIDAAINELNQQNIGLLNIIPQQNKSQLLTRCFSKIKSAHLADFMQQLAFLLNANIPLATSLGAISKDLANPHLLKLTQQIKADIEAGNALAATLQKYPKYFPKLWCNLIATGEKSGTLDTMLRHIAEHINKSAKQKRKLIKALFYPIAVLLVAITVTAILLVFVIPQFQEMFNSFGARLPAYTQLIINIANSAKKYGILMLASCFAIAIAFHIAKKHSLQFAKQLDSLILKIPFYGKILHKDLTIQYSRILHITLKAGIPLLESLTITQNNINNWSYQQSISKIQKKITDGNSLNSAMRAQNLFPERVLQLISLGEEMGNLDKILATIANYYEEELNYIIDNLNNLLEPLLMLVLGIIVGSLVIGMYLPIFRLGNVI